MTAPNPSPIPTLEDEIRELEAALAEAEEAFRLCKVGGSGPRSPSYRGHERRVARILKALRAARAEREECRNA